MFVAILRAVRSEKDERIRLRDEILLALLIYTGLRAQVACHVQIRDLDLDGGTIAVSPPPASISRRMMTICAERWNAQRSELAGADPGVMRRQSAEAHEAGRK